MEDQINSAIYSTHEHAWKKASPYFKGVNLSLLVNCIISCMTHQMKPEEAAKELGGKIKKGAFVYAEQFLEDIVDECVKNNNNNYIRNADKLHLGSLITDAVKSAGPLVMAYADNKISEKELAEGIIKAARPITEKLYVYIKDVGVDEIAKNTGVKLNAENIAVLEQLLKKYAPGKLSVSASQIQLLLTLAGGIVGVAVLSEVYKYTSSLLRDVKLAHEERLAVEAECAEAVDNICRYRLDLEEKVSLYLSKHIEEFNEGFAEMDNALLSGDSDGFIAGNVRIQEVLGRKIQFKNQKEFDELMLSDESFKL